MTFMNAQNSPTCALIDLEALRHNCRTIKQAMLPSQRMLAVVKADAYGHGAIPVSYCLQAEGVQDFGVARVEEGVTLRKAGLEGEILVFGGAFRGQEKVLLENRLTPTIFDLEAAQRLNAAAAAAGETLAYHLKIDTGMSRIGFLLEDLPEALRALAELSHLRLEGVYSHFALADSPGHQVTSNQVERFRLALETLKTLGVTPGEIHLSNSAGILTAPLPDCTLVRPGISLYGSAPSAALADQLDLHPVMTFQTQVARLQDLPAGTGVSYGHQFVTSRPTRLASLPVGYADGFHRGLSNQVEVLIRGEKVPVVGTICMDWALADVTDLPEVAVGDKVTLLGCDGDHCIRSEEWATRLNTISYEIYCQVGARVPRCYPELE